jgi:hypothetical protein
MAGLTMLSLGTLDEPSAAKPAMQIFCTSAFPWAVPGGDTPEFSENALIAQRRRIPHRHCDGYFRPRETMSKPGFPVETAMVLPYVASHNGWSVLSNLDRKDR